jgi:Fur family transcriptional regulator, peroxide stress response regulator
MARSLEGEFQKLCREKHLAATHQRLVIYRAMMQMPSHPNPEQIFERVRTELPSISLATVYKTVHLFIASGIIREVSPHHGSLRVEPNAQPHHHFVCLQCHAITDLALCEVDELPLRSTVPEGYQITQVSMEVRGFCSRCASKKTRADA